jgi:hypothetical protein
MILTYILEVIKLTNYRSFPRPSKSNDFTSLHHIIRDNLLFCIIVRCKQMNQQIIVKYMQSNFLLICVSSLLRRCKLHRYIKCQLKRLAKCHILRHMRFGSIPD